MRQLSAAVAIAVAVVSGPALAAPNLVSNGDFSSGNTGFTSSYVFSPGSGFDPKTYDVRTDPGTWHPFFISTGDHTTGSGNMFVGNGASTPDLVWQSAVIAVTPNTDYFFEAFIMNVCCNASYPYQPGESPPISPAIFQFSANGVDLGGPLSTNSLGAWEGLGTTWHSGAATTVTLSLYNANTAFNGNDFAVDDIYLGTESTIRVPEPASLALFGTGLLVLAASRRRRR